jgi:glycosyltransferase involved in cell wall biosynthesis
MERTAIGLPRSSGRSQGDPLGTSSLGARLHFVVVGGLDPAADDTWSGVPKAMVVALRAAGHRVSTAGPLPRLETGWPRLEAWWHSRVAGKNYLPIRDPAVVKRRAGPLTAMLRALEPYDAVIAWHAADAAIVQASAPLIFVHDATWSRLLDFYPQYRRERLTQSTITGGKALDRVALENCAHAIYSSHWAADAAHSEFGVPTWKLAVHPFGVDLRLVPTDNDLRDAIAHRGRGPCRLLFVGVDWLRKGGGEAIDVARLLNERGIVCELDVAGADPPENRPDWVHAHGRLLRTDPLQRGRLASLLLQADFLVLPTRADCTPIILSEAAAFGLPSVTVAVGGIPEIVGETGWAKAFPAATRAEAFADWIERAYRDRTEYRRLAWLARCEYANRLNWPAFVDTLTAIVDELRSGAAAIAKAAE